MTGVAVVTGAGKGIGRATALALAKRGLNVALLGRTVESLELVASDIVTLGRNTLALRCDASQSGEVERAAKEVIRVLGVPNVVVANAGIVRRAPVHEMKEGDWDEVIAVNLKGTFLTARSFLPKMLEQKRGRIVCVGSVSATVGTPQQSAYCAAKWGVIGFMKSLAEELRTTGVQAMAILPGSVATDMLRGSGYAPQMTADEVAGTIAYLALDAPDSMNGSAVEAFGP